MNANIDPSLIQRASHLSATKSGNPHLVSSDSAKLFQHALDSAKQALLSKQALTSGASSLTAQAQSIATTSLSQSNRKKRIHSLVPLDHINQQYLAQFSEKKPSSSDRTKIPLQVFLDQAIQSLQNVSDEEHRMNDLIQRFVKNDPNNPVSEDEVVLATAQLNLSISMVTTVMQSAVQTFKEIQQIPV